MTTLNNTAASVEDRIHSIELLSQAMPGDQLQDRRDGETVVVVSRISSGALLVESAIDRFRHTVTPPDFANWRYDGPEVSL